MSGTLSEKILKEHLVEGNLSPGEEIALKLDHCLLQDATGTMAWLEFEAMGISKVKPEFVIQYVDHNMLQADNKNMDDHLFLMTIASKHGAYYSAPGNGISHHVHKERFTKPGGLMIGSDSHTPTAGGSGMMGIGCGGLEVAVGMATGLYRVKAPEIVGVKLTNELPAWSTANDVILEVIRRIGVKGGKGKILEYFGPGVETLSVSERSTIGNMGAETGATTTIFPTDARTQEFFKMQDREKDYKALTADENAEYADIIEIDLATVEPLIACPHSPGNVKPVREVAGLEISQAIIGSSTNSSFTQFMRCAHILNEKGRNDQTFYHVVPGSRQLLETIAQNEGLMQFLTNGARITEPSCNACIGMGNAPATGTVSIRSFPRNWEGRSGTRDDQVYLASPEVVTASATTGEITDPRDINLKLPTIKRPAKYAIDDKMIIAPLFKDFVRRGPNIKALEYRTKLDDTLSGGVMLKVEDDISTDHIMPAGANILPLRSNIPAIAEFVFSYLDPEFVKRAKKMNGGFIVGGVNYGQGSSREHAAIAPMHLGLKAVLAKGFARIHASNLVNFGILPLVFKKDEDYARIDQGDELEIPNINTILKEGGDTFVVKNKSKENIEIEMKHELSDRQREMLLVGGLLNYTKQQVEG